MSQALLAMACTSSGQVSGLGRHLPCCSCGVPSPGEGGEEGGD